MITTRTLQAELAGEERAIRHLTGERAALTHKLARAKAREQLLHHEIHARLHPPKPAGGVPHGDRYPDVSSWQPDVVWEAVLKAHSLRIGQLAFTKISEGETVVDELGPGRWQHMLAAGLPHRGAYHYLHPDDSPARQAALFLEHVADARAADILACDLETSDGQPGHVVARTAHDFAAFLRQHTPAKLWLYIGGPFAHEYGVTLAGYDAHWLPAYVSDPRPYMVFGASRVIAWQYTDGVHGPAPHVCPGIGACDLSIIL